MKTEKIVIAACCSRTQTIIKIDRPITQAIIDLLKTSFKENVAFTKVGMLYMESSDLIITAPMGADRLTVKCKKNNCDQMINDFQNLLINAP
jgi:hypothetical protein